MRQSARLSLWAVLAALLWAGPTWAAVDRTTVQVQVIWYDTLAASYVHSDFDLLLWDDLAPITVANFKQYINSGDTC